MNDAGFRTVRRAVCADDGGVRLAHGGGHGDHFGRQSDHQSVLRAMLANAMKISGRPAAMPERVAQLGTVTCQNAADSAAISRGSPKKVEGMDGAGGLAVPALTGAHDVEQPPGRSATQCGPARESAIRTYVDGGSAEYVHVVTTDPPDETATVPDAARHAVENSSRVRAFIDKGCIDTAGDAVLPARISRLAATVQQSPFEMIKDVTCTKLVHT